MGFGDHSIDLDVAPLEIDGIRVVRLSSILRSQPSSFERASLASTRGNGACSVPKFDVVEATIPDHAAPAFRVRASLVLFADHLSVDELSRMTWLFLKEADAIDNELADILSGE